MIIVNYKYTKMVKNKRSKKKRIGLKILLWFIVILTIGVVVSLVVKYDIIGSVIHTAFDGGSTIPLETTGGGVR